MCCTPSHTCTYALFHHWHYTHQSSDSHEKGQFEVLALYLVRTASLFEREWSADHLWMKIALSITVNKVYTCKFIIQHLSYGYARFVFGSQYNALMLYPPLLFFLLFRYRFKLSFLIGWRELCICTCTC